MTTTSARLDPAGRLRLPRRATLLRLAAAAALLLIAAAALYSGDRGPPAATAPPPASASPDPGGRLPIPAGKVGVPVTLGDPAGLALLQPGDRVDLFAVTGSAGEPERLATDSPVLAVDRATAALLLALSPEQGEAVVTQPAGTVFAVLARG
ncbi:MAG TPA: flagellar biosynthesis protein FlgA [Natronosporangium sp.]